MAVIKKESLVDQVYQKLRGDLLSLQLPLGSKLNVSELQEKLGVSCTPIREAINRLQQEGLVVYQNNVGAHILTLDAHDVEEIQQLAMTLHRAAITLAIGRGAHAAIAEGVEKCIREYSQAKTVQAKAMTVNRLVGVFYHNCGNRRLDNSMISIQGQQLLLRYIYATQGGDKQADLADFQRMAEGTRQGNAEVVCQAFQAYTDRTTPEVLAYISNL